MNTNYLNVVPHNPERYCGWFWIHCSPKKFERTTREAMDVCLRELKESNKSRFDSYSVRNGVLIISHITFRGCGVHTFSDNLSWNSCIHSSVGSLGTDVTLWRNFEYNDEDFRSRFRLREDSPIGKDRSAAYTNAASSYCFEIIYNKNLRAGYWRFIWCFCIKEFTLIVATWVIRARWREIRRFVL